MVYDYKNNIQELMKINKEMAELRHEYKDSVDIVSNMLLSRILPSRTSEYLSAPLILEHILGESVYSTISSLILPVCSAVFIALVIFFIYINIPWKDPETKLYTDPHLS